MFGSENVKVLPLVIQTDPAASDEMFYLMKAPRALTVEAVYVVSEQTQNAGTAILARLENWGTAGTAVAGTVCGYVGGTATASRLTARTPAAATITSTEAYVDKDEWLVVHYAEEGAGWIANDRLQVIVQYTDGKGV